MVLKYSKGFQCKIAEVKNKGYQFRYAKVNFILFWKDKEKGAEYLVILPELSFEK